MRQNLLILMCLCLVVCTSWAQDPVFSQFYNAPVQLNPGLVGLSNNGIVTMNYRNQWSGWPEAYTTYAASFDKFFEDLNSGFGGQVLSDNAGDGIIRNIKISGIYAYQLNLTKSLKARVGMEASFYQTRLDWDKLVFFDQLQPSIRDGNPGGILVPSLENRPENLSNTYADFSLGGIIYNENYYIGISIENLTNAYNGFIGNSSTSNIGLPMRLSIHGGWEIDLDGYNKDGFGSFIAPSILYTRQAGSQQVNAGAIFNFENLFVGGWVRHNLSNLDALIVSAGWRTEKLKLSYSFDMTLSDAFITRTGGSHELGVHIYIGGLDSKKSRYEDCFSIFR